MRKHLFKILLLILCSKYATAQQNPLYSQYMFNQLVINPAYSGTKQYASSTLFTRKQWVGFSGSPLTVSASLHGPLKDKRTGLGFIINNDHIGVTNQTDIYGTYAYHVPFAEGNLSMGISGGISFYRSDLSSLNVWDANDNVYQVSILTNQLPNFGTGLYYSNEKWYVGLSVPQLLSYDPNQGVNAKKSSMHHPIPHYYFTTGYVFTLTDEVALKPSCLVKYVKTGNLQFDINMNVLFNQIVWVGASYRYKDAVVAIFEYQINRKLRLGYSYDYPITSINTVTTGSHEIMLGYDFGYNIMKIKNPRYF